MKIHCEICDKMVVLSDIEIFSDDLNQLPWGDIVCPECYFVIATIQAENNEEGIYNFKKNEECKK